MMLQQLFKLPKLYSSFSQWKATVHSVSNKKLFKPALFKFFFSSFSFIFTIFFSLSSFFFFFFSFLCAPLFSVLHFLQLIPILSGLWVADLVWFVEHLRHQDQSLLERKGQKHKLEQEIEEEREISIPLGDARKALLSKVGAQVTILNSTFSWKEADRAATKHATHVLVELAKNSIN